MSNRCTTVILPIHNTQTMRVLLTIILSEGKTDNIANLSERGDIFYGEVLNGWPTRRQAEGWSEVFQTDNLHITIRPDDVRYNASDKTYRPRGMRVQMSAYSCDPYGREAIAAIVASASTRF